MAVFGLLLFLAGYGCLFCVFWMAVLQSFWLIYLALLAFSGRMLVVRGCFFMLYAGFL